MGQIIERTLYIIRKDRTAYKPIGIQFTFEQMENFNSIQDNDDKKRVGMFGIAFRSPEVRVKYDILYDTSYKTMWNQQRGER